MTTSVFSLDPLIEPLAQAVITRASELLAEASEPDFLSANDIALRCGMSERKAYELLRTGEMRTVKIGRHIRVPIAAYHEWRRNLPSP